MNERFWGRAFAFTLVFALCYKVYSDLPSRYETPFSWGEKGTATGQFDVPSGIDIDSNGVVYVVDQNNKRIQLFTDAGKFISEWRFIINGKNQFKIPSRIAVAPNGDVYVTDMGAHCVFKFDKAGHPIAKWGGYGEIAGRMKNPLGICVDKDGLVYVADTGNQRIQKFSPDGKFIMRYYGYPVQPYDVEIEDDGVVCALVKADRIYKYKPDGTLIKGYLARGPGVFPVLEISPDGYFYIAVKDNKIRAYTMDDVRNRKCYGNGRGRKIGQFDIIGDMTFAENGDLLIVDKYNHRIQKFSLPQDRNGNSETASP